VNKAAIFCIMWLCFMLSACSPPLQKYNHSLRIAEKSENSLYTLRIEQWGNVKFTGLLALQLNDLSLSYAMLDATGIKLIEGEVDSQGKYTIQKAMIGLKGSSLPGYLSTSLARTFLMIPLDNPCSRDGLMLFCISRSYKIFSYRLATYDDFIRYNAREMRGITFVKNENKWEFFN